MHCADIYHSLAMDLNCFAGILKKLVRHIVGSSQGYLSACLHGFVDIDMHFAHGEITKGVKW